MFKKINGKCVAPVALVEERPKRDIGAPRENIRGLRSGPGKHSGLEERLDEP